MQLRRLAALERQKIEAEHDELMAKIADYNAILESPERQRQIVSEELQAIVDKYGDDRRSQLVPYEGDMSIEDLIPEEDVVVTITRGGYTRRTKTDLYRSQKRGGKGVKRRAAEAGRHRRPLLRHHHAPLAAVLHEQGPGVPGQGARAAGHRPATRAASTWRTCWRSCRTRRSPRCCDLRDYEQAPYLVLATKNGLIKKTPLKDYDSPRSAGVIAINLREDDELIAAELVSAEDDLLLVSKQAQGLRFTATDEALRPMGRATSGVIGMRFREDDELLSMDVVRPDTFLFTATSGGYGKRTRGGRCSRCAAAAAWASSPPRPSTSAAAWSAPRSWTRATRSWPSRCPAG